MDIFNITCYTYPDVLKDLIISNQFIYNRTMPIFYHKNNERGVDKDSPFYSVFYEITNSFEQMIIKTSKTTSFLKFIIYILLRNLLSKILVMNYL